MDSIARTQIFKQLSLTIGHACPRIARACAVYYVRMTRAGAALVRCMYLVVLVRRAMDDKNVYNDRFLLPDPLSYTACSRTTRYRIRKRLRHEREEVETTQDLHEDYCEASCSASAQLDSDQLEPETEDKLYDEDTDSSRCEDSPGLHDQNEPHQLIHEPDEFQELCDRCDFQEELENDEADDVHEAEEVENLELEDSAELDCPTVSALYDGSTLSRESSGILIMQFKTKHNLTLDGLADLLKLIKLHCPTPNQCFSTPYLLRKHFASEQFKYHHFCSSCLSPYNDLSQCPNMCSPIGEKTCSFLEVSIESQLQTILQSKCIWLYCSYTC